MKVVINKCYGGFSLSPAAIKRLAELNGRECYFFKRSYPSKKYTPITMEEIKGIFYAFDIPNPNEVNQTTLYKKHHIDTYSIERTDPKLIQVIEELGSGHRIGASGAFADLRIVEIPDGVQFEIKEYDGMEHIDEVHRSWV